MVKPPEITEYLEAALRGGSLRQAVIANNIANLNTPGFRRSVVPFEQRLAEAITEGREVDLKEFKEAVIQPKNTPVDSQGNDVSLEMEIGEMVKSNLGKTYLRLLAKMYQQMELAMDVR
jgi:flagellar basal-body rod protein FlgB